MNISITDSQTTFIPENCPTINAPFVTFSSIDLTGDGGTVFISVSLDHKNTWINGIFMNSRFLKLKIADGKLSCVSKSGNLPTFRKCKASNPEETVSKLNKYISKVEDDASAWIDDWNCKASPMHY